MHKVSAIVCVSPSGGIGDSGGNLLYKNTADMVFFVGYTLGKICLVGHNTLTTLPKKMNNRVILPDTRELKDLSWLARNDMKEVVVIGGAATYTKYAPQVEELYITTMFKGSEKEATTFFDMSAYAHLKDKGAIFKNRDFEIRRWA